MDYYEGCYGCKCLAERITKLEQQLAAASQGSMCHGDKTRGKEGQQ